MRIAAVLGARKMSATSTAGCDNGRVSGGWLHLVQQQVERMAGAADRIKVADALRAMNLTTGRAASCFPGPMKFDDKGRHENVPMIFAQWQKGVPVTVFPEDLALAKAVWPSV
jgi:branched-chain amino acid transport system substrate-binding protein